MGTYVVLGIAGEAPVREQHVMIKLIILPQLLNTWNFLAEHGVLPCRAEEIGFREIPIVAVGVFSLNNGSSDPRCCLAREKLCCPYKFRISATVWSLGKALH